MLSEQRLFAAVGASDSTSEHSLFMARWNLALLNLSLHEL